MRCLSYRLILVLRGLRKSLNAPEDPLLSTLPWRDRQKYARGDRYGSSLSEEFFFNWKLFIASRERRLLLRISGTGAWWSVAVKCYFQTLWCFLGINPSKYVKSCYDPPAVADSIRTTRNDNSRPVFFRGNIQMYFIFYHFPTMRWHRYPSYLMKESETFILHNQYHGCWRSGDEGVQGISSDDTDLVFPWYFSLCTSGPFY